MFIVAHIVAGLLVGKFTGQYWPSLFGALFVDLDHLIPYAKHRIFSPRRLWEIVTSEEDALGGQRNALHSLYGIVVSCGTLSFPWGLPFLLGYLSHLLLDALDHAELRLPPLLWDIRGPIPYFSWQEGIFTAVLLSIWLL